MPNTSHAKPWYIRIFELKKIWWGNFVTFNVNLAVAYITLEGALINHNNSVTNTAWTVRKMLRKNRHCAFTKKEIQLAQKYKNKKKGKNNYLR